MQSFIRHQWLKFFRSPSLVREMSVSILTAFLTLMVTLGMIALGFMLPRILPELSGDKDPLMLLQKGVVYYFLLEFIMRYLLQKIPMPDIEAYLCLPISRKRLTRFLLLRSFFNLFNVYLLILVLPYALQVLVPQYGAGNVSAWIAAIVCISWSIHFLHLLFKSSYDDKPSVWVLLIAAAVLNYSADRWWGIDILQPLYTFFLGVLQSPELVLLPVLVLLFVGMGTYHFLRTHLYLENRDTGRKQQRGVHSERLEFLNKRGLPDLFILQEIRLIFRHKRTRSVLVLSFLFVLYGLLFFGREEYANGSGIYIMAGIFMSGLFTINYGQFFWGWNTNQLDFFFSRPVTLNVWVESRYRLLVISALISTLLCLPYLYFGWTVILTLFSCMLFNIGINIPLMMRMSMWQPKAIDLDRHSIFNYQGTGIAQWLMAIPLLVLPYLVYLPFSLTLGFAAGIAAMGIAGVIGFLLRNYFLDRIVGHLKKCKYAMIRDLTL